RSRVDPARPFSIARAVAAVYPLPTRVLLSSPTPPPLAHSPYLPAAACSLPGVPPPSSHHPRSGQRCRPPESSDQPLHLLSVADWAPNLEPLHRLFCLPATPSSIPALLSAAARAAIPEIMRPSSGTASPSGHRKRSQPVPVFSGTTPPDSGMQDGALSSYDEDFPADFSSSSTRPVRRRLSILSDDLQQPNSTSVVRPCKKRGPCVLENPGALSRRLRVLSFSTDGGEASASSKLSVPSNDVAKPGGASSLQLCRKRKPSALEDSRRVSRRLNEPSHSRVGEDENDQLPASTMAVSSTGHRRELFSNTSSHVPF
ncbi:hypothetical protein EJB05_30634, partial [Eragrostis curvula]